MDKLEIRKAYKKSRLKLDKAQIEIKSKLIAENFIQNLLPKITDFKNKKLAFYFAEGNESDPIHLIKYCQNLGNVCSLPKIQNNSKILEFKTYKVGDELIANCKYSKLLEPQTAKDTIIPDIIFAPLVAFDDNLNRLGTGGGFYDTTITHLKEQNPELLFIGIAFEMQKCANINTDTWDKKLDFLITEERILF